MPLADFRSRYHKGQINSAILKKIIAKSKGKDHVDSWLEKLVGTAYDESINPRIGLLRANWKNQFGINLEKSVHSAVFRIICSYLDQGISMWKFPVHDQGFLSSIKELEKNSYFSFFKSARVKSLLFKEDLNQYGGTDCIENFFTRKFENKIHFLDIIGSQVRWASHEQVQYF